MVLRILPTRKQHLFSKTSRSKGKHSQLLMLVLAIGLLFGYRELERLLVQPQAILVLGGSEKREMFAAEFAHQHPELHIWVSGGSSKWYAERLFYKAGIAQQRLHLDYQAVDTVTNFTTLADKLKAQGIKSVYLITSDYHMRRARVIGEIVLGSRGIILKPVPVPTGQPAEPIQKAIRDGVRAILWMTTGYTGATLGSSSKKLMR